MFSYLFNVQKFISGEISFAFFVEMVESAKKSLDLRFGETSFLFDGFDFFNGQLIIVAVKSVSHFSNCIKIRSTYKYCCRFTQTTSVQHCWNISVILYLSFEKKYVIDIGTANDLNKLLQYNISGMFLLDFT